MKLLPLGPKRPSREEGQRYPFRWTLTLHEVSAATLSVRYRIDP